MRIKIAAGEKEKNLEERVMLNLKAGKTIDSRKMAAKLGVNHGDVELVFKRLVSKMVAEKVV